MSRPYKSPKAKGWKKHSASPEMFLQLQFASDHGKVVDPSDIPAADIAIGSCPEEELPSNKYMTHIEVKQCEHVIEEIKQETTIATESFHLQLNIPQPGMGISSTPEDPISTSSSAGILEVVCATPKMIPKPKVDPLEEDEEGPEKPTEEEMDKLLTTMSSHAQPMPPPPPPLEEQVSIASKSSFVGSDAGSLSEKSASSSSTASLMRRMSSPKSVLEIQVEDRTSEKPSRRSSRTMSSKSSPKQKRRSSRQVISGEPVLEVELTAEENDQIISASMRSLPADLKGYREADEKELRRSFRIPSKATMHSASSPPPVNNLTRRRSVQGPVSGIAPPSPRSSRRRSSVKAMPTIPSPKTSRSERKKGLSQSEHVTKSSSRSEQKRNSSSSTSGRRESYSSPTPRARGRRSVDSLMLGKSLRDACPTTDGGAPMTRSRRDSTSSRRQRRTLDLSSPGKASSKKGFQSARALPFVADLDSDDDDEAAVRVLDALLQ